MRKDMSTKKIWLDGIMGLVVGDALGVPVEFKDRAYLKEHPVTDMMGYGTHYQPAGTWSDDSSMTLATLDSLKDGYDPEDMMGRFAEWILYGEYTPYGKVFDVGICTRQAIHQYWKTGDIAGCGGTSERDNGNGSLMRILPVVLYCTERVRNDEITYEEAYAMIHEVSALTHAHLRSKMACGIYFMLCNTLSVADGNLYSSVEAALEYAFGFYGKRKENHRELGHYDRLRDLVSFAALPEEKIKSSGYVVDSLEAALWCLLTTNSYEESVLKAVNLGSDTDTVAAIAGGLAGIYYGYESIPEKWKEKIARREWVEEMCYVMDERENY